MKRTGFQFLFALHFLATSCFAQAPVVKTTYGQVSGTQEGALRIFKGIPFAAPPVGKLRWKEPQPPTAWKGVLKCESFSASPMQPTPAPYKMWSEEFIPPVTPLSEDCLYLNVWTPAAAENEKLPVVVWIYGGGFIVGSAACPIYDGAALAKKGVVFVSFNYRVGVFGFLAHRELSASSGKKSSGNFGLLDQIAALKWVQKNIAAFGGDPNNVTIAGQSAGSMSVQSLIFSPLAKNLFQHAIAQSGGIPIDTRGKQIRDAEKKGEKFMTLSKAKSFAEIKSKSAAEIQKIAGTMPFGSFIPVFDDYVLPVNMMAALKEKKFNDVDLLMGWATGDEIILGNRSVPPKDYKSHAVIDYKEKSEQYFKLFPGDTEAQVNASISKLALCEFVAFPDYMLATTFDRPSYLYAFTFVPTDKPGFPNYGAFHSADIPYALHTLDKWDRPWESRDEKMQEMMSSYWVNFIKTGNPNGSGLPEWKSFSNEKNVVLEFGDDIKLQPGLLQKEFTFLKSVLPNK